MVLPFVIVYIVGFVFVFRSLLAVGVAEHYEAERYDLVRHSEEFFDEGDTFADRVAATPDCAEAYGIGGKKDVFGSGRAVLHPIAAWALAAGFQLPWARESSEARSVTTRNFQGWRLRAVGAAMPARRRVSIVASEIGTSV